MSSASIVRRMGVRGLFKSCAIAGTSLRKPLAFIRFRSTRFWKSAACRSTSRMPGKRGPCQAARATSTTLLRAAAFELSPRSRHRCVEGLFAISRNTCGLRLCAHSAHSEGTDPHELAIAPRRQGHHRRDRHEDHSRDRWRTARRGSADVNEGRSLQGVHCDGPSGLGRQSGEARPEPICATGHAARSALALALRSLRSCCSASRPHQSAAAI